MLPDIWEGTPMCPKIILNSSESKSNEFLKF